MEAVRRIGGWGGRWLGVHVLPRVPVTPIFRSLLILLLASAAFAEPQGLREGNRQFWKKNYDQALKQYSDALIDAPNSSVLHFNAGDAAYQAGNFERAVKEYGEAAHAVNPVLQTWSHYNRGNALFRQNKFDEAIDAYKQALRIDPKDEDAKYNLSVALDAKQHPPKPSSGPSKPQDGKDKDEKDGKPKPEHSGMNKEDAERVLSAVGAGEAKKKRPPSEKQQVDEDW